MIQNIILTFLNRRKIKEEKLRFKQPSKTQTINNITWKKYRLAHNKIISSYVTDNAILLYYSNGKIEVISFVPAD